MGIFGKDNARPQTDASGVLFEVWGQRGWPSVEVVGESYHSREIRSLFPRSLGSDSQELSISVTVTHDAGNAYDKNAVAVTASTGQLGHLSREDAGRYAPVFSALQSQGLTAVTTARVWGYQGVDYDTDKPKFIGSVTVDLPEPHMMVPANLPPDGDHVMLPVGAAIQVTGEENHMEAIAPFLNVNGECWVHATLHEIVEQSARSAKTLVEVRVNGQPVGRLTPKMSSDMLPVVNYLSSAGKQTGVRAIVKGNPLKAEVVLYTLRASELPADWFAGVGASRAISAIGDAEESNARTATASTTGGPDTSLSSSAVASESVSTEIPAPPPLPPADWFPDPQGVARLRYWDGARWTEHTAP